MKLLQRLIHDRRALSAVLSHLLLTVVAVAIMAIATSATFVITSDLRENMAERVIVEDVWFNSGSGTVDVYLYNVGKVDIQIQAVYINHVAEDFKGAFSLKINENGWLIIPFEWKASIFYSLDIVTSRGVHVETRYKAP